MCIEMPDLYSGLGCAGAIQARASQHGKSLRDAQAFD